MDFISRVAILFAAFRTIPGRPGRVYKFIYIAYVYEAWLHFMCAEFFFSVNIKNTHSFFFRVVG